jgi:Ca-activated chloride channel family protein
METLADHGNGNYAYIDSLEEAQKVLVEQAGATLVTIAKDVKIQVEFNPALISAYRLVGYENRSLAHRDFNDDRKDAGDIGSGHTVTALYEVIPAGYGRGLDPVVDPLRYQHSADLSPAARSGELMTLKLRYKRPNGVRSRLMTIPVRDDEATLEVASADFRFSAAVATFGMLVRGSKHARGIDYDTVRALAASALGTDRNGHRAEFLALVERAAELSGADARAHPRP